MSCRRILGAAGKLLVGLTLAVSSPAVAGAYCTGLISKSLTFADGRVMIFAQWRGEWTAICSLKAEWKGVSTEICWAWYAAINEAVTQQKQVTIYYEPLTQAQCANVGSYDGAEAPGYVMVDGAP